MRSLTESLIYEVHVKNATQRTPASPRNCGGRMPASRTPRSSTTCSRLGVTAVELLPVHAFTHEPDLVPRGLDNHWGYNTLGFFAPHAAYASAADPQGALDEFKGMVKDLHAAGIEVLLDVVYNHTAEHARDMMTLSWRGLDERAYYRFDGRGLDIDVTGCGNTLDLDPPRGGLGWCSTPCATGCRSATSTASASTSRSPSGGARTTATTATTPSSSPCAPIPCCRAPAGRRAVGPRHPRLAHGPVPAALLGVERPLPRRGPDLLAARPRRLRVSRGRPRRARAGDATGRVAGPLRPP